MFLALLHFVPFALASIAIVVSYMTGLLTDFSVKIIQNYMSNYSVELFTVTALVLMFKTVKTQSQVYGAFLGTYVLLAITSEFIQMFLGVPAIRELKPDWDERRGLLYPARWYKVTDLWSPQGSLAPAKQSLNRAASTSYFKL